MKAVRSLASAFKNRNGKYFWGETGEDAVAASLLPELKGRFIDVGASHPIFGNNTYFSYRRGWTGIAIEPIPHYGPLWKIFRRRDQLIRAVVAKQVNPITFQIFDNPLLSTSNKKISDFHKSRGLRSEEVTVETVRLSELLPTKLSSIDPFLLNIDVEGNELDVLKTIDFINQRPRVIMIETWQFPWVERSEALAYLENNCEYKLVAYTGLTAILVPTEYENSSIQLRQNLSII